MGIGKLLASTTSRPLLPRPAPAPRDTGTRGAIDSFAAAPRRSLSADVSAAVPTFVELVTSLASSRPGTGPTGQLAFPGKPLQIPLGPLRTIDLDPIRRLLERILPQKVDRHEGDAFRAATADFRTTLGRIRALEGELGGLPPGDPRRPPLERALAAAERHLVTTTGYSRTTAPRAGAMWVDPQFLKASLSGGLRASKFPTGTPVTSPPDPLKLMFGDDTARARAYMAEVAATRKASGMPVGTKEPTAVHLSLMGGGGRGKRYGAMMEELISQGVVPVSVTGTSAGSIAAAVIATGAPADRLAALAKDPRLEKLYDYDLDLSDGGLLNGQAAFDFLDSTLRELTGITDRPVTFADLKMPLKVVAAVTSDDGRDGFATAQDRVFVFSQETTPDTPVALAVRASMAIPGVFEPVQMVDPVTGREVQLVDGGTLDNLPVGYGSYGLPELAVSLHGKGDSHPSNGVRSTKKMPTGQLDADNIVWNALNGYTMLLRSNTGADDWQNATAPRAGQFNLSLPVWDLEDPRREDAIIDFPYDPVVDPVLDRQTRAVTRSFLVDLLDDLGTPGARGSNVSGAVPRDLSFQSTATVKGTPLRVLYKGGDDVITVDPSGRTTKVPLGREAIEEMWLDDQAFGDLSARLSQVLSDPRSVRPWWLPF